MSNLLPIILYFSRYQDVGRYDGEDSAGRFARFVNSYKRHPAGHEHELFIIKKGYQEHENIWNDWTRQLDGIPFQTREYPDKYFTSGYIRNLMEEFPDRYILVCVATSEILVDNWLDLFMKHASPNRILGSMGSHWDPIETTDVPPLTLRNIIRSSHATRRKWWSLLWGHGLRHPFKNTDNFYPGNVPHLRTTTFMLPPRILERIFYWPRCENNLSKNDDILMEFGKFSLTAQALLAGLEPLVVGADGRSYTIKEWPESKTFFVSDQENLIVGDHFSRQYEGFPIEGKKKMTEKMLGYGKESVDQFIEQVMSSDTSQIETFFLRNAEKFRSDT